VGILFVRSGLPAHLLDQYTATGVRTIGHALGLDPQSPLKGLKKKLAVPLKKAAWQWIKKQIAVGPMGYEEPAEPNPLLSPERGKKGAKRIKELADTDDYPVQLTRETLIANLWEVLDLPLEKHCALMDVGTETIGELIDKAGPLPYSFLRHIKGLSAGAANAIGDALVDAGLIGEPELAKGAKR